MNPKSTQKKGKRFCSCCSKTEDFDSNEVIFECFGKEFTEYEYVIENLAIRPAPKKLLDLVPVHSTNISKKSIKIPTMENHLGEPLHKSPRPVKTYSTKRMPNDHGDGQKPDSHDALKKNDDFISLKILPDEAEPRMCGPSCNKPASSKFNPCSKYPYDQKPGGSCKVETIPEKSKHMDSGSISDVLNLRRIIKSREYRTTTKQILADLCEASEQSLKIKPKHKKLTKTMPMEIKDTIEELRFKKPIPQFFTRTEKKPFHKPGVYFTDVQYNTIVESNNHRPRIGDGVEKQRLNPQYEIRSFNAQSGQSRLSNQSPRLSGQSGQSRPSGQYPRLSGHSDQLRQQRSDTTIDDLSEHVYENQSNKMPVSDSIAQTDISKQCTCPTKEGKNLKWKIIINKHSNC